MSCGPAQSASPPPPDNSPETRFANQLTDAFCKGLATCCMTTGAPFAQASCQENMQSLLATEQSASKNVRFDQSAADACLASVNASVPLCAVIDLEPCNRVYVGTLAAGAACVDDSDCAPVAGAQVICLTSMCRVIHHANQGDACKRTCYKAGDCTALQGEPAFDPITSGIATWSECYTTDGLGCVGGSCVRGAGVGSACLGGEVCDKDVDCVSGACQAYPPVGGACGVCAPEQYCNSGACATLLSLGARCDDDQACASGRCDSTCTPATGGQPHGSPAECGGMVHL